MLIYVENFSFSNNLAHIWLKAENEVPSFSPGTEVSLKQAKWEGEMNPSCIKMHLKLPICFLVWGPVNWPL
jgi:hypothetical protein